MSRRLPTYNDLRSHIRYHRIREWLLEGAKRERAHTIEAAIKRLSQGDLERRFARMLSKV
jgi:hypothetical protein